MKKKRKESRIIQKRERAIKNSKGNKKSMHAQWLK